jgi:hypothetical protein
MKNVVKKRFFGSATSLVFTGTMLLLSASAVFADRQAPNSLQELEREQEALFKAFEQDKVSIHKKLELCKDKKESECSEGLKTCTWFIDRLNDINKRLEYKIEEKKEASQVIKKEVSQVLKDQTEKEKAAMHQENIALIGELNAYAHLFAREELKNKFEEINGRFDNIVNRV